MGRWEKTPFSSWNLRSTMQCALEFSYAPFCYSSHRGSRISVLFFPYGFMSALLFCGFRFCRSDDFLVFRGCPELSVRQDLVTCPEHRLEESGHDGQNRKLLSDSHTEFFFFGISLCFQFSYRRSIHASISFLQATTATGDSDGRGRFS